MISYLPDSVEFRISPGTRPYHALLNQLATNQSLGNGVRHVATPDESYFHVVHCHDCTGGVDGAHLRNIKMNVKVCFYLNGTIAV